MKRFGVSWTGRNEVSSCRDTSLDPSRRRAVSRRIRFPAGRNSVGSGRTHSRRHSCAFSRTGNGASVGEWWNVVILCIFHFRSTVAPERSQVALRFTDQRRVAPEHALSAVVSPVLRKSSRRCAPWITRTIVKNFSPHFTMPVAIAWSWRAPSRFYVESMHRR